MDISNTFKEYEYNHKKHNIKYKSSYVSNYNINNVKYGLPIKIMKHKRKPIPIIVIDPNYSITSKFN
jgi:hypothetical protein